MIKGQALADFLVEHPLPQDVDIPYEIVYLRQIPWKLYFNGSSIRQRQGICIMLISPKTITAKIACQIEGTCGHNRAEYEALMLGLEVTKGLGAQILEVFGDSQLVISQVTGKEKCIEPTLVKCPEKVKNRFLHFQEVEFEHIACEHNRLANELAQFELRSHLFRLATNEELVIRTKRIKQLEDLERRVAHISAKNWRDELIMALNNPLHVSRDSHKKYVMKNYISAS